MKQLLFLPIDLPLGISKEEVISNFRPDRKFHTWKFERLTEQVNGKYGKNYITEEATQRFPTLTKFIELLPFDHISNVKINLQTGPMVAHVDFTQPEQGEELWNNTVENEPCGYRLVIHGANDVMKIHKENEVVTAYVPTERTHAYVINQSTGLHSVIEDPDRITCYTTGFINQEQHNALLKKSLSKYGEYAVWRD